LQENNFSLEDLVAGRQQEVRINYSWKMWNQIHNLVEEAFLKGYAQFPCAIYQQII
jgi:hypothetical protein